MSGRDPRILVFANAPVPGKAKTRLIPMLGADRAARLQRELLHHALRCCADAAVGRIELWTGSDCGHPEFARCARDYDAVLYRQHGRDLGSRMHRALASALRRGPTAVLIGVDIPSLGPVDLTDAVAALSAGQDAVLAPALDGGYVLIGVRRTHPLLFDDIAWSTGQVLDQTRSRLASLGWRWCELRAHADLDRPEDWLRLLAIQPEWARRIEAD